MRLQTMWILCALLVSLGGLVACGESGKGSSAANNDGVSQCTGAGQVYVGSYGNTTYNACFSNTNCAQYGPNYAYIPSLNQCIPGVIGGGGGYVPGGGNRHLWSGYITFTSGGQGVYREMMKDKGICGGGHMNSWSYLNCDQWDDVGEVAFEVMSSGVIPAYSYVDITSFNDYNAYYPSTFTYEGTASPINTNTGFSLQALGTGTGYNKYFKAEGNVGALISGTTLLPQFQLKLFYNNQQIGYANVGIRY